jgi:transaldolase
LEVSVAAFVKKDFCPRFDKLTHFFGSNPLWQSLRDVGSVLWLDTGSIEEAHQLWSRQFSALTTNNTLLNKEVRKGTYDWLITEASKLLDDFPKLSEHQRLLEIAFIINAKHALKLVEKFDAFVSVEEHTDLADDVEESVYYAQRYYSLCPERFIIKIPFTPAGILATRRLYHQNVPVNHTLGFSARQNYLAARIGKPAYVNVFLGRLNSFIEDNNLGDGAYVGEKTLLASQAAIKKLRGEGEIPSHQIAASIRSEGQIINLAGADVMTIPPKVAARFLDLDIAPQQLRDKTSNKYIPDLNEELDYEKIRLGTLWDIEPLLVRCIDELEKENLDSFSSDDLVTFLTIRNCPDVLIPWQGDKIRISTEEGKIPKMQNWKELLEAKCVGLDSIMNLAGLCSFALDQKEIDDRIRSRMPAYSAG